MGKHLTNGAIIVAAGKGLRAGGELPKQYQMLAGKSVLRRTVDAFLHHPEIDKVLVVIGADAQELYETALEGVSAAHLLAPVLGGATRQASVRNGLEAFADIAPDNILIHDAARPMVDAHTISAVIAKLAENPGAIAALPANDTLKLAQQGADLIDKSTSREGLWRAQTPQGFHYPLIRKLHDQYAALSLTDDASLMEEAKIDVALISGRPENFKITQGEDFAMAEKLIRDPLAEYRTGHGFDVHAFEPGSAVTLCGVQVPHTSKLKGHSDADVGMHALTDAIYGALGAGDIGDHFPPSEEKWRGAASHIFLEHAAGMIRARNGQLTHCDVTLICEQPKIGPHRTAMREALSRILGIDISRISVKATTTERLGFTGREEGISAMATATISLPL